MKKDIQKSKIYDWENIHVAPYDKSIVPFQQIENIVKYIWENENLQFPPQVFPLPKHSRKCGDATRLIVRFQNKTYTWIVLHELAHAMSSSHDGKSNKHGAIFMQMYCQLLHKYLKLNLITLTTSAENFGIKIHEVHTKN